MKKAIALVVAAAAVIKSCEIKAGAWFKKGHINIVEQAFEILKNDNKIKELGGLDMFLDQIIYGSCVPDVKGDCDNGRGLHYYSPRNKFGLPTRKLKEYYPNRLGGYSKSAGTIMEECYYTALILWQNKKHNTAAVMLGRCLHFLADICCVPHTTSRGCSGNPKNCHTAFETYANKYTGLFNAMTSKKLYDSYLETPPLEIANILSEFSSGYYEKLVARNHNGYDEIIVNTLPLSQMAVAALIYKFSVDAKGERLIDERKFYSIRNCETGNYLQADGTVSEKAEKFKLKFYHDGSVGFESEEGCTLAISRKFTRFRLTLKDENLRSFRITCKKKFSRNIAEIPLIRLTAPVFYRPDLDLHFWTIREAKTQLTIDS